MYIYLISNAFVDRDTSYSPRNLIISLKQLFLFNNPYEITMTLIQMLKSEKLNDFKELIISKLLKKIFKVLVFQYLSIDGEEVKINQKSKIHNNGKYCKW